MRTTDRNPPTTGPRLAEVVELPHPDDPNLELIAALESLLTQARSGELQMMAVAGVKTGGGITSQVVWGDPGMIRLTAATSWLNHRVLQMISTEKADGP